MTATDSFRIAALMAAAALIVTMTACDLHRDGAGDEEHVLRVHDVSQLQIDELDTALSALLLREDLPLRGTVERIDQGRIAVNGSELLQTQITRLLADLAEVEFGNIAEIERDFRLQFWLLTLAPEREDDALPPAIDDLADVIRDQFPQHGIRVRDFIETFASNSMVNLNLSSGRGTSVWLSHVRLQSDGVQMTGRVHTLSPQDARGGSSVFNISRHLRAGQPLVLGRAHGGSVDEQAIYHVVVARMDWND